MVPEDVAEEQLINDGVADWVFADRVDAERYLARRLSHLRGEDAVVVGLPRGGAPVAAEVARELHAPST